MLLKVRHTKHVGATLRGSPDQARGLELDEVLGVEVLGEQLAGSHANIGNGLLDGGTLVHDGVVEVGGHAGRRDVVEREVLDALLDFLDRVASVLVVEVGDGPIGNDETHAQDLGARSNAVTLSDVQFVVRHADALDRLERLFDLGLNQDVALEIQSTDPLDHLLGDGRALGAGSNDTLDSPVALLTQLNEGHLGALHAGVLDPGTDLDRLAEEVIANVLELDSLSLDLGGGSDVAVVFLGQVLGAASSGLCGSLLGLVLGGTFGLLGLLLGLGLGLLESLLGGTGLAALAGLSASSGGCLGRRRVDRSRSVGGSVGHGDSRELGTCSGVFCRGLEA